MLRLATAGSVDDGKSTLIGRLLFDSKQTFIDQMEAIERSSRTRGEDDVNLAYLTDGLRSEREQGITIDVAYRYFSTPRRKFILADTPGHVQYTRNMVTGASTADAALLLVDARRGVLEQTRRHAYLSNLLGIRHFVLCVNKMDLVDWDRSVFDAISEELTRFAGRMGVTDVQAIPISAKLGDWVVEPSQNMSWYPGPPLLELLETLEASDPPQHHASRFPVQYVVRPLREAYHDYRGYAGTMASGVLRVGDRVKVMPSGAETTVAGIDAFDNELAEATPPMAVTVRLTDQLDIRRGSMIVAADHPPIAASSIDAHVCWMSERVPLRERDRLVVKHTTQTTRALVEEVGARLDVNTLEYDLTASQLSLNEIGRVRLRLMAPLSVDPYDESRETGAFILIDEATSATVGAGMITAGE
ncbi:MAG: sulfate adenylyltransferase [Chloroflexi bacterium]|nr:sulfate adenylyltransferase [Chloroflexota bacterium]